MVSRGQIWWAELPNPAGSEPGFTRPVLVIQADSFNHSRIGTVVVVAITSNLRLAKAPGNVSLSKSKSGLSKDSVANVSQISTLDKEALTEVIGTVGKLTMQQVDEGIKLLLSV
ncbi:MAG TPA: type II toxin-antitoxin system PemK/MazF family toxin [Candidatus Saccharimonadales bacterium]|nr:type II toxin-antitoxin system PemK/MazF family toxin [Candidatus Saccharimonadales bacterium]